MEALKRTLLMDWTKLSYRSILLKSITSPKCGEPTLMPWFPSYRNLVMVNPQPPRPHYLCWGCTCNKTSFSVTGFQLRVITENAVWELSLNLMFAIFLVGFYTFKNLLLWLHILLGLSIFANRSLTSHSATQRFCQHIVPHISMARFLFQNKIFANG